MITALLLVLFFLSSLGSWELLRRKTSVHVLFLPSLTIAVQTGVLLIAGLLHCLPAGVIFLLAAGIFGLGWSIFRDRGLSFLKNYRNAGYAFLAVAGIAMFLFLFWQKFYHYDNFSHWALVIRQMLETNHFPEMTDKVILFRNYPLGSSVYIYFFCRVVSSDEGVMMFAQVYMMLTAMLPLMLFLSEKKEGDSRKQRVIKAAAGLLLLLAAANFFLVYNIPVQDLLVDSLLPLTGMCAFVYAWKYGRRAENMLAFAGIACYLIQLVQIKNSGWFFAAFLILWILLGIRKDRRILLRILTAAAPVLSAVLWKIHCKITFTEIYWMKHSVSLDYYRGTLREKTAEDIRSICSSFLKFTVSWKDIWLTAALAAVVFILVLLFYKTFLKTYGKLMLFALVLFVIYQAFLLVMYLISMPAEEAAYLAEAERYTKTILMAVIYLLVLVVMKLIREVQGQDVLSILCAAAMSAGLCLYLLLSRGTLFTVFYHDETYGERDWLEDTARDYDIPMKEKYCIIPLEADGDYSYFLGRYLFYTDQMEEYVIEKPSDMDQVTAPYIFLEDGGNEAVREWVQQNFPEQAGNDVIIR